MVNEYRSHPGRHRVSLRRPKVDVQNDDGDAYAETEDNKSGIKGMIRTQRERWCRRSSSAVAGSAFMAQRRFANKF